MKKGILSVLLFLMTASILTAEPGSWKQIGKSGDWSATIAGTAMNNKLYTVETSGALYETDLSSGQWKQIGKKEFGETKFIFGWETSLYTIETSGSLYEVSTSDGSWKQIGKSGDWIATIAGCVLNGKLFTIETGGTLYETDLSTGTWKPVGKPEFGNTRLMVSANGKLYTIETSGSLYEVNPVTGGWEQIGKSGDWSATIACITLNGKLYSIENSGALYVTDLTSGAWKKLGRNDFAETRFMFGEGKIFTIEKSVTLYQVETE